MQLILLLLLLFSKESSALEPINKHVDMMLVLAVDVSASVDDKEYDLQKKGIADTLLDDNLYDVLSQCNQHGIALTYVEWTGHSQRNYQAIQKIKWMHIKNKDDLVYFAQKVLASVRLTGFSTDIEQALFRSYSLLTMEKSFSSDRKVILLSGDGPQNIAPRNQLKLPAVKEGFNIMTEMLAKTRDEIIAQDITINALVITNEELVETDLPLDLYFQKYVIGGPNSFIRTSKDYKDYKNKFLEMLLRELNKCIS